MSVSLRAALCAYISAMGTTSHERLGKFEEPKFEFLFCYNDSLVLRFFFFIPSNFMSFLLCYSFDRVLCFLKFSIL